MNRACWIGALPLVLAAALSAAPPESSPKRAGKSQSLPARVSAATQKALEKELAGDNAARQSLLQEQVTENPDDPSAHWHLGEVREGDKWVRFDRAGDEGDRWRELFRYSQERSKRKNTVEDHLFLADGARAHGLFDQERAHLAQVVVLDRRHEEAHRRLGDIYAEGTWIPRETFEKMILSQRRWSDSLDRYGKEAEPFVARLRRHNAAGLEKIREDWEAWIDPEKLPALERAVGDRGDAVQAEYVRWLGRLSCYEASRALVRQTLFSDHDSIRLQATEKLKRRPWEDYMRELVASLTVVREGKEPNYDQRTNSHLAKVSWETMDSVVETQWLLRNPLEVIWLPDIVLTAGATEARAWNTAIFYRRTRVDRHQETGLAASQVWQTFQQARADGDTARTERGLRTVGRIGKTSFGTVPEVWEWWSRAEDTIRTREWISRSYEDSWYVDNRRRTVQPSSFPIYQWAVAAVLPPASCLTAGTCLTTETGPRAVETLEIGDRVLAQDIETGELRFKPVMAKTVREGAALSRFKTADEEVVCSQGHPFWVNAVGWVQARALQPGMPLHTGAGAVEVASIEPAGEGTVYNIVVADSHTYFVGKTNAFLSHDPTPRGATNALVPGLLPVWEASTLVPAAVPDKPVTAR